MIFCSNNNRYFCISVCPYSKTHWPQNPLLYQSETSISQIQYMYIFFSPDYRGHWAFPVLEVAYSIVIDRQLHATLPCMTNVELFLKSGSEPGNLNTVRISQCQLFCLYLKPILQFNTNMSGFCLWARACFYCFVFTCCFLLYCIYSCC